MSLWDVASKRMVDTGAASHGTGRKAMKFAKTFLDIKRCISFLPTGRATIIGNLNDAVGYFSLCSCGLGIQGIIGICSPSALAFFRGALFIFCFSGGLFHGLPSAREFLSSASPGQSFRYNGGKGIRINGYSRWEWQDEEGSPKKIQV